MLNWSHNGCGMPRISWRKLLRCLKNREICENFLPRKFPAIRYLFFPPPSGCDPLLLGSVIISSSDVNSRCSSLISSSGGGTGSQSQVEGDNGIIFCYSSPGGGSGALQGTVATAFCDDGYEREGAETVTCGPNGSWGDLPRCSRSSQMAIGTDLQPHYSQCNILFSIIIA